MPIREKFSWGMLESVRRNSIINKKEDLTKDGSGDKKGGYGLSINPIVYNYTPYFLQKGC